MGRLPKKKTSAQKKKKLTKDEASEATTATSDAGQAAASLTLVSTKEAKRKPIVASRKAALPAKAATGPIKRNVIDKSIQFLREVKVELKKVTWPSRKQAVGSTLVVLVLVAVISLFLGVIDIGLSSLVQLVLQ